MLVFFFLVSGITSVHFYDSNGVSRIAVSSNKVPKIEEDNSSTSYDLGMSPYGSIHCCNDAFTFRSEVTPVSVAYDSGNTEIDL